MSGRIHLSSPDVTEAEEQALVRAIRSGWVAPLGPEVDALEVELAGYCGREHALALSSGTAALHLGLLVLGVVPGDLFATSTLTFAVTANAITYTGAQPVFVDCDDTGYMNGRLLADALAQANASGEWVAAVVPVDLLGNVVDHGVIGAVVGEHGIPVLSDAAESLGARRDGVPSAAFGEAAAVSFNGNKIMTTSGGGAFLTDDAEQAARIRYLATPARQPAVHYEHTETGYSYRTSNILTALRRAQLARLDSGSERRRQHRALYRDILENFAGVSMFGEPSGVDGGDTRDDFWLTSILIDVAVAGFTPKHCALHWKQSTSRRARCGSRCTFSPSSQALSPSSTARPSGSFAQVCRSPLGRCSPTTTSTASAGSWSSSSWVLVPESDLTVDRRRTYDLVKRALDRVVSGIGLAVSAPVQIVTACVVLGTHGRPVVFRQPRTGKYGVVFELVKFRSIRHPGAAHITDAEELTLVGQFLRSTSPEELPTLWNVRKGDMSLVGPRPLLVEDLPLYSAQQARRHEVRPGVTGVAQVSGRNALSWQDKFALDVNYVDRLGFHLDLSILARTVTSVLVRQGITGQGDATMSTFVGGSAVAREHAS